MKYLIMLIALSASSLFGKELNIYQAGKSFIPEISKEDLEGTKNSRGKYKKDKIKKYQIKKLSVKKGDTLVFHNKDTVVHNVFGDGFNFNQELGSINKKTFTEPGVRTVRCAIHPKMKLKITVSE